MTGLGFHSHDGWHWKRLASGEVQVVVVGGDATPGLPAGNYVEMVISPATWASIVASVSASGETDGRFYRAQEFHG